MSRINLYSIFHLNLAFSSISEKSFSVVIKNCYWPILNLAEDLGVKVGIEATGYTLEKIEELDPAWILKLKQLIKNNKCEFLGSGYAQIIGPLVPAEVNLKNLQFGDVVYKKLLEIKPEVAYINEQTYAEGLIELYLEAGYKAIVAEWNNAFRFHSNWEKIWQYYPQFVIDQRNIKIALIWNNTTTFQKFQTYVHGELSLKDYLVYLKSHIGKAERFLPIYGNDAEAFDFRPGRYSDEISSVGNIEWKRIRVLFRSLLKDSSFNFVLPSKILTLAKSREAFNELRLESPEQPIVVKKQEKYNVTRWALTGANDIEINTECFKIYQFLRKIDASPNLTKRANERQKSSGINFWKELCFLWGSDFRTHIEKKKFEAFSLRLNKLAQITDKIADSEAFLIKNPKSKKQNIFPKIKIINDGQLLFFETKKIKVGLNKEKGLAIDSLVFKDFSSTPVIATLPRGYYGDISLEEDFYSGNTDIMIPGRREISDLKKIEVLLRGNDSVSDEAVKIEANIKIDFGTIKKTVAVYKTEPRIDISYEFNFENFPPASFRSGIATFNPEAFDLKTLYYSSSNGGRNSDKFGLNNARAITTNPVSLLVTARSALGNTDGILEIGDKDKSIVIKTDMAKLASLPMINFVSLGDTFLLRVLFSLAEIDDTSFVLRDKEGLFKRKLNLSLYPKSPVSKKSFENIDKSKLALYQSKNGLILYSDFIRAIRSVGIKKGDTIFVHSDVSAFGKILAENRDLFFESFVNILKTIVGKEGTIIMPTFTYSMTGGKIFDVNNSPSTVGALTEYFRKQSDVKRTVEPILSVAIWGNRKKYLSQVGNDSYGRGSIFDKFHALKGKILLLGTSSCTFFHHIESMHEVPYRFKKKFNGKIRNQGKTYDSEFIYLARRLDKNSVSHFSIAADDLLKKGLFKKIKLGNSAIASVKSGVLFKEVYKKLDSDVNYYLNSDLTLEEEKKLI